MRRPSAPLARGSGDVAVSLRRLTSGRVRRAHVGAPPLGGDRAAGSALGGILLANRLEAQLRRDDRLAVALVERRRPSRSCRTCPAIPSTIDVQRPTPTFSFASSRSNTQHRRRARRSPCPPAAARRSGRPRTAAGRRAGRRHAGSRRECSATFIECPHRARSNRKPVVIGRRARRAARAGRAGARGQRRLRTRAAGVAERRGHHARATGSSRVFCLGIFLLVEGLLIAFVIRYRRRGRAARRRRRPDPRLEPARARLDAVPGRRPVRDRASFVFVEAARDPGRPGATGGRENLVDRGDRHAVRVAVPLPERRRRGRPAARAAGPHRRAARDRARLGRDPLVVDPGARRQDRRDPGHGERDVVRGAAHRVFDGPVRRALRPLPREDARGRRGDAGRGVRRVARRARGRSRRPARRRSARRRGQGSARSATGPTARAATGPRIAGTELVDGPGGDREAPARGPRRDAARRARLGRRRSWTRDRLPGAGPWQLASSSRRFPPGSAAGWRAGSSPSTTSGSASSTSRPPGSSSPSPASSRC